MKKLGTYCLIGIFSLFALISSGCAPAKLLQMCHPNNPYVCSAQEDPNDPKRLSVEADCLDALLTQLEFFHENRSK